MPMNSPTALSEEIDTAPAPAPGPSARTLRPHQVLVLSLWCGLVAGPLEVGAIVLRKHTMDLIQFYWMSRHFVWLIPLTNLLVFLVLGLVLCLVTWVWPRRGSGISARLLCALTLLPLIWALFPGIYGPAGLILVLGIATGLVPVVQRHAAGFRWCVQWSFPVLPGLDCAAGGFGLGGRSAQGMARGGAAPAGTGFSQRALDRPGHRGRRSPEPPRLQPPDLPDPRGPGAARHSVRPRAGDLLVDVAISRQLLHGTLAPRAHRRLVHSARRDASHAGGLPGVSGLCHGRVRRQPALCRCRHGVGTRLHARTRTTSSQGSAPSSPRRWSAGQLRG